MAGQPASTRDAVAALLDDGRTQADIARRLELTPATVSYHVKVLGRTGESSCGRRYDWAEVQRFHDMGHSTRECMERFGFSSQTWHEARGRGILRIRAARAPIETYLVRQTPNWSGKNKGRRRLPGGAIWLKNVPHRRLPVRGTCR